MNQKYQVKYAVSRPKVHGEGSDTPESWDALIGLLSKKDIKSVKEIRLANGRHLSGKEILNLWKDVDSKK